MNIAIIGLGYVGLPLLCAFSSKYECWGLDKSHDRVNQLLEGIDNKTAAKQRNIRMALKTCHLTSDWNNINDCDVFIVTIPTPVDCDNKPDTTALEEVCENVGRILRHNSIVVFESTVYPGTTEELCIPILEKMSCLRVNHDFYVGYSPERINVGDKKHQLTNTSKIVSASNEYALNIISDIYRSVIRGEIVHASSIKVAEAAKMYENVQRDVLIALANQYANYCHEENIEIKEVIRCASSKWNFVDVLPGLVGGHCISVDPYYLLERAERKGIDMPLVHFAREANEGQAMVVANRIIQRASMIGDIKKLSLLVLGFAYKSNTSDIRNTKIASVISYLKNRLIEVECYDPLVNSDDAKQEYGLQIITKKEYLKSEYDVVVKLVNHKAFNGVQLDSSLYLTLEDLL
jgi:UDP-N-acetyl-D-galactosamine dehydrogenase